MSTKTTFKRVALVAIVALGFGGLATVPANAAPSIAYTTMADTTLGQQEIGGQATVTVTVDSSTVTNLSVTGVGSIISVTDSYTTGTWVAGLSAWSESATSAAINGTVKIVLTSAVAGTTTITAVPLKADGTVGTAVTKNVTWVTAASKNVYSKSLTYITADTAGVSGATYMSADSTTAALTFSSTVNTTQAKAEVWVKQFSIADTTTVSTLAAGKGKAVKVEITGAGSLGSTDSAATGPVLSVLGSATTLDTANTFFVFSDGRSGLGTITISVDGAVLATKTVRFTGTNAAYTSQDATKTETLEKNYVGVGESATISIYGLDASGFNTGALAVTSATSETSTIATVTSLGGGDYYITGIAVGKTTIIFANAATSPTIKYVVPIEVTKKTGKAVLTFDKSSYNAGEKVTWKITATDANGRPVADGKRVFFSAFSANMSVTGSLPDTTSAIVDGVATGSFFAPAAGSGTFVLTATEGSANDNYIAGAAAAAAAGTTYTAAKVTSTFTIVNSALDAATDAANEATDAANAATDAANAAAEAADAATAAAQDAADAVAALSTQVNELISALKKQITALTAIIVKIQKKLGVK